MSARHILPPRALVLWCAIVPVLGLLGIVVASWILPTILALQVGGVRGLSQIRLEWHVFAHAPTWLDPVRNATQYRWVEGLSMLFAIPGAATFGVLGHRLWHYLAVRKLRWATEEDVQRFNNKQQYM